MKPPAAQFMEKTFKPDDRLAFVLVNRASDAVTQRITSAGRAAHPDFQYWLRDLNRQKFEVYFSPNTLHPESRGRTKADIQEVRHIYLDFDDNGTQRIQTLSQHGLPEPSFVINSSNDRYQAFWSVQGFDKASAESLMRSLTRETGADPAATDCSRVMRLPGLYNHKYGVPQYVRVDHRSEVLYTPDHFPHPEMEDGSARDVSCQRRSPTGLSQSERDFAYAIRALRRGDDPNEIAHAIAQYRVGEKSNPHAYAERTVRSAAEALSVDGLVEPSR